MSGYYSAPTTAVLPTDFSPHSLYPSQNRELASRRVSLYRKEHREAGQSL